jgi:hypothetical protein
LCFDDCVCPKRLLIGNRMEYYFRWSKDLIHSARNTIEISYNSSGRSFQIVGRFFLNCRFCYALKYIPLLDHISELHTFFVNLSFRVELVCACNLINMNIYIWTEHAGARSHCVRAVWWQRERQGLGLGRSRVGTQSTTSTCPSKGPRPYSNS